MVITEWDPPRRVVVQHTGRIVRGPGIFEIEPRGDGVLFAWTERLHLPFGLLGEIGWLADPAVLPRRASGSRCGGSPRFAPRATPPDARRRGRAPAEDAPEPGRMQLVSRRGWALFLAMSVIWGVPYLLIKVAVGEVSPVMLVFVRCVVGAALLLPWTIAKGQLRPALRHWRALLLFTALEMAGPWLLIAYAEETLSSSLTGLLVAGVPFVAALAARLLGGRSG